MKYAFALSLVAAGSFLVGCQNQPKPMQIVPPPPSSSSSSLYQPAQVEAGANQTIEVESQVQFVDPPAVADVPAVAPAIGGSTTYVIQKGDTLWSIAQRHYGSGLKWPDIVSANPGIREKVLIPGKTITLP
ncbi:LysM peptidoglycan-binding domain-containing protein [Poriferisphaera sp. WC338]|uniref:LysM peptidoglycan-binding domain-containing protein n=1 Tax=Poriferisphaera sp. WC338 TaxID=3425129 RepID=UPI003D818917